MIRQCWCRFSGRWGDCSVGVGVVGVIVACRVSITIAMHCFIPNSVPVQVYRSIQWSYRPSQLVHWHSMPMCWTAAYSADALDSSVQCRCAAQQRTVPMRWTVYRADQICTALSSTWSCPELSKYILCTVQLILYSYVRALYCNHTDLYKWGPICTAVATVAYCSRWYSAAQQLRVLLM